MLGKTKWRLHTMYWRSNADISPGDEFYTTKDTYICSLVLPHLTVARRLLEIVTKFFFFFLSSARLAPLREQCRDQTPTNSRKILLAGAF